MLVVNVNGGVEVNGGGEGPLGRVTGFTTGVGTAGMGVSTALS